MAFFKFRFPGKTPEAATEGLSAAPGESMEVLRRRARHRLFGSVVLVFVAVVAFPLLFDSQPRPVAVDTPIVIPDRNSTPPLSAGTPVASAQAPAKPLLSATAPAAQVPAHASLEPGKEEVVAPTVAASVAVPEPTTKPASAPAPSPVPKASAPVAPAKAEAKPETREHAKPNDAQKARALLEGKNAAADQAKVIIQVGAFTDADKVRDVRRKLEHAGLKTFIQTIEKDGKRTTRVRVGPFETRTEADKAAARIRKLDLPASVIVL